MAIYMMREFTYTKYTISWEEKPDMSSGWVYSDDAAGMTAGSSDWDTIFGYYAVKLSSNGTETAAVSQTSPGVLSISSLGTLTSGDDVMIKFPVRGIKMSKSGSIVSLSITPDLGLESEGFQYYAFQSTGDIEANASTTVGTKPLYLGAYLGYTSGSKLYSLSGKTPAQSVTIGNYLSSAQGKGTGWSIEGWYAREYINALYMMKYGNPDCMTVIGQGYTNASRPKTTGGTNGQTNATYGTSSGTVQCKLFGLEDWWGNQRERLGGVFLDSNKDLYIALHDFTDSYGTSQPQYKKAGNVTTTNGNQISSIIGDNKSMFGFNSTETSGYYKSGYCAAYGNVSCEAGGDYIGGGMLGLRFYGNNTYYAPGIGARLMYL